MANAHHTLLLYKRHSPTCAVHKLNLAANRKRYWMDCRCMIWIVGRTEQMVYARQSTGLTDQKEAIAYRNALLSRANEEKIHGPQLKDCIEKFLDSKRNELSDRTLGQYKLLLKRLSDYCKQHAIYLMHDLTVDVLETFKTKGFDRAMAETSKSTSIAKLRCFLGDAYRRGWIEESLRDKVRPVNAVYTAKEPYSDAEVDLILDECLNLKGGTHGFAKHPQTLRLLLELMLETGLRVGDAVQFEPNRLEKSEFSWIYTYFPQKARRDKAPKPAEAFVSFRLKEAIDASHWLSRQKPFFGENSSATSAAQSVYERMQSIGTRCGVADCRPHRLRHTFAVRLLLKGMQLGDVSRLLAHSSVKVTETYYAKWITARKVRLERILAQYTGSSQEDQSIDSIIGEH